MQSFVERLLRICVLFDKKRCACCPGTAERHQILTLATQARLEPVLSVPSDLLKVLYVDELDRGWQDQISRSGRCRNCQLSNGLLLLRMQSSNYKMHLRVLLLKAIHHSTLTPATARSGTK